jgi:glycosyltransferase involved in cell wall biosynthesis
MRISVIIPAYNAARFLPETIESVIGQSERDWELIVIDDGSRDQTAEIAGRFAERDSRIRMIGLPNGGVAAARNAGFQRSDRQSKFICYLDHDDLWTPDALEILTAALEARPEAIAAAGLPQSIDADGRPLVQDDIQSYCKDRFAVQSGRLVRRLDEEPTTFSCFAVRNCIITPGLVMIRRDAHEACGLYDESLSSCDDWDLWLRLTGLGDIAFVNRVILKYRLHQTNQSRAHKTMEQQERRLYAKLFSATTASPVRLELLRHGYRFRAQLVAQDRLKWAGDAFRRGDIPAGLSQLRHGIRMYWRSRRGFAS